MIAIDDEMREKARTYLKYTDEFICDKTMQKTLMQIAKGEIDEEKIERARKEKELKSLQEEDVKLDEALSLAEKITNNRNHNSSENPQL